VFFDFVAQGERGAGVAGLGGVELVAERSEGAGAPGRGERVEPHVQDAVAWDDVAAGGEGFADEGEGADAWIRRTTIGCVTLLALIAGTVSYLHMHRSFAWAARLGRLAHDAVGVMVDYMRALFRFQA